MRAWCGVVSSPRSPCLCLINSVEVYELSSPGEGDAAVSNREGVEHETITVGPVHRRGAGARWLQAGCRQGGRSACRVHRADANRWRGDPDHAACRRSQPGAGRRGAREFRR
ncbi:hypothetical protein XHV734_0197 [Xanthomonas hortorum pv. vitians]|nr:hypothetical protein XHV734_0197 [Xanthomonas hortorum pv. vitians]